MLANGCSEVSIYAVHTQPEAYPSCPNSRPENKKPSTGDALTDLNSGMTKTVAAKNVRKSKPKGTRGSGAAEAVTFLLARLERWTLLLRAVRPDNAVGHRGNCCCVRQVCDKLAGRVGTDLR